MPRTDIELGYRLQFLSVLTEHGELDRELEPAIADDTLRRMHRTMLLARRFDERALNLQRQGRLGTLIPAKGQEASQIGAMAPLNPDDWFVPSFRETPAAIWRGTPLSALLLYNAGYNEGGKPPQGWNNLPPSVPVGSQIPHAVGLAYAARQQGGKQVALVFFGDGATSEGDFHEALNFAAVFATPTLFLCQNNHWAISIPREKQTRSKTLAEKAFAYGMPGIQVDGNDVLAVYAAVSEATERARNGDGPTLVECITYRLSMHTTADDPTRYRKEQEVEEWSKRDPLPRFQRYLIERGLLSEQAIDEMEKEVAHEIEAAWEETQRKMHDHTDPLTLFEHIYREMPPYLREQRDALRRRLEPPRG